ncbi:Cell cycle checkpoint protein RAD17 [Lasiodiplodia hormozganensis]|uniref:Cell cycle checkpoint protein RAD17 n=1 Tax=Lasiodiplodia hormozganensis TaxID=869390 RepID=A0AA39YZW5_9PEZI|nr:Cell cycle checkpoint protein RAD17 [Lasiodiplodia hormozganensis]
MPQPRSTKRKAVVLSSDEDEARPSASPPARDAKPKTRARPSTQDTSSSRSSQPRAKPKPKPQPKEKPIYSFFNAATQRQRTKSSQDQPAASQEAPHADFVEDQDDIIQDDSLDDAPNKSGSRSTWLKRARGDAGGPDQDALSSGSQKFLKTSSGQKPSTPVSVLTSSSGVDQRPWVEKYGPVNLDELAVHKKKVADVRAWLTNVLDGRERKRLLVLKGVAGTAKTTTVNLLAKDVGFEINEWKNPMGSDFSSDAFVSLSAQFEDFMGRSKFGSLDFASSEEKSSESTRSDANRKQIVLIEEFPNTFARSSAALQSFRSSIEQYLSSSVPSLGAMFTRSADAPPPTPIVMIISETLLSTNTAAADSFTAHRLLGPDITNHPGTTVIEFNPIAPTFLTKALELVVAKEARKSGRKTTPGPQVIKKLSEIGDVRSAISTLEFLCLRGDDNADWGNRVTFKPVKKGAKEKPMTKMEEESMALVSQRESTLGIFHAVGKVVYNKRDESADNSKLPQPPAYFPEYRRPKASEIDVDALMDELGTDIQTFTAALHENYVLSCNTGSEEDTLDSINGCIDALSDADLLSPDRFSLAGSSRRAYQSLGADSLRQDEMSFQASVRGLLFNLPHPVKRSTLPPGAARGRGPSNARTNAALMFYPTSLRLWRLQEEIQGLLDVSIRRLQSDVVNRAEASVQLPARGTVESWSNRPTSRLDDGSRNSNHNAGADITQQDGAAVTTPLGSSGSLKREMLLERLPYTAMMLRRQGNKKTSNLGSAAADAARLSEVEKITSFSGVGISADDGVADADDGVEDVLRDGEVAAQGQEWSTDRPAEQEPPSSASRPSMLGSTRSSSIRLGGGAIAGASGTSTGRRGGAATTTLRDDHIGEIMIGAGGEQGLANLVLSDDDIEDDED